MNKVLANVLEEEVSCDVDLHEAIEDQDFEVRGTCGWCGRLQINLTLGSSMRVVEENRVESYKARAWNYWGSNRIDVFWSNYPSRKMMQLILRRHWKLWWLGTTLILRQVTAIKNIQKRIVAAQTGVRRGQELFWHNLKLGLGTMWSIKQELKSLVLEGNVGSGTI